MAFLLSDVSATAFLSPAFSSNVGLSDDHKIEGVGRQTKPYRITKPAGAGLAFLETSWLPVPHRIRLVTRLQLLPLGTPHAQPAMSLGAPESGDRYQSGAILVIEMLLHPSVPDFDSARHAIHPATSAVRP